MNRKTWSEIVIISFLLIMFGCAHQGSVSSEERTPRLVEQEVQEEAPISQTEEVDEKELAATLNAKESEAVKIEVSTDSGKDTTLALTETATAIATGKETSISSLSDNNTEEDSSDIEETETVKTTPKKDLQKPEQKSTELKEPPTFSGLAPTSILVKDDTKLNRYYFVREGDNPELVSKLIYGTPVKADSLLEWNGRTWTTGKALLYSSPKSPESNEILSFYEESNTSGDTYTIQPGDSLSRIAKKRYQSIGSWKEIAAVNHLKDPNFILAGQVITLLPTVLRDIQIDESQRLATSKDSQKPTSEKSQDLKVAVKTPIKTTQAERSKSIQTAAMEFVQALPWPVLAAVSGLLFLILCLSFWRRSKKSHGENKFL